MVEYLVATADAAAADVDGISYSSLAVCVIRKDEVTRVRLPVSA